MVQRGPGYEGPDPPEPWPGRHEAFMLACALHAGHREKDVLSMLEGLAEGAREVEEQKQRNPMRR